MGARGAAALALLALACAAAAALLWERREEAPSDDAAPAAPSRESREPRTRPPQRASAPGVSVTASGGALVATNDDGEWTILTHCRGDETATVGPGYVSRLVARDGTVLVDDRGPPQPLNDPGYGGLGAFAWHHARGIPGQLRLDGDNAWEVSGRICADDSGGFGVSGARLLDGPAPGRDAEGDAYVAFAVEVELTDAATHPEPLVLLRYRYRVHRGAVRSWIAVAELCPEGRCGRTPLRAFVKEPKLAVGLRSDDGLAHSRAAVFDREGELRCVYVGGGPPEGPVLDTGQCGHPARARVRFDAGSAASGVEGGCDRVHCLSVTMGAYPAHDGDVDPGGVGLPWYGSGVGLDAWAQEAGGRPAALAFDTASIDGVVWDCHGGNPAAGLVRRWETIARVDEDGRHLALSVLFPAWQGGRGGYDCEPLLRTFGARGATWGAFAEYALESAP